MLQFEKYNLFAGGILAGSNSDMFGIGTAAAGALQLIGTLATNQMNMEMAALQNNTNLLMNRENNNTNLAITQSTNAANESIAEKTNETNLQIAREANEMSIAESEKAYQRSTAANQIAELIRAGFTPQQAKQIVGSSGSAASYPAAPITSATAQGATMQPATMQAGNVQFPQLQNFGTGMSQLGSALGMLGDDLLRPDGGSLGALRAQPVLDGFFPHMDTLPEDTFNSVESFQKVVRDEEWQKNNSWFDEKLKKQTERLFKNTQGVRSFLTQSRQLQESYSSVNQVKAQYLDIQKSVIQLNIDKQTELIKINMQKTAEQLQEMDKTLKTYDVQLSSSEFNTKAQELLVRLENAKLNLKQLQDDTYKDAWLAANLSDLQTLKALNDAKKVAAEYEKAQGEQKKILFDLFGSWITTWQIFNECGLTKSNIGVGAALVAGTSIFAINGFKKLALTQEEKDERKKLVEGLFGPMDKTNTNHWIDNK